MSYSDNEGSPLKKVAIGAAVLLAALIAGAIARSGTSELINYSRTSPTAIEGGIEEVLVREPQLAEFYRILKTEFPEDYQRLLSEMSAKSRAGDTPSEIYQAAFKFMQKFARDQAANIQNAPRPEIQAIVDANVAVAETLARSSPTLCAHFSMEGLRPTDQIPASARSSISSGSTAIIKAAAAGRDRPVTAQPSTEDDWILLLDEMYARGVTESEMDAFLGGAYASLPDEAQCRLGRGLLGALADMDGTVSTRIMREILADTEN